MKKIIKLSMATALLIATNSYASSNNEDLGMITVSSATKSEQSIQDVTSNVEVISNVELEDRNIDTVTKALNLVSGISFTSNGGLGATKDVRLRGMNNNRTLVLIDGIKYQDPSSTSGASTSHLMLGDIEKIEIIKGAQSGIWGADATAGVVNIITKNPQEGTHGSIFGESGSFNTKKYGMGLSHKENKFDIKVSAQKITSDSFSSRAPRYEDLNNYEDDKYENTTVSLKSNYNINDDSTLGVSVRTIDAKKEYDSFNAPNDETMKSDVSNKLYNLTYKQKYNKHNIKLSLERSEFSRDEIGTTFGVKSFNGKINNIEINDNIQYNNKDFFILGMGTSDDNVDFVKVDNSEHNKKNRDNFLYITNSNTLNNTILTQSARYDKYNNFDNKFTGKLGIKHNYSRDIYVSSNIGTGYNVPNIMQELNPWGTINNELNPENSKSADITLGYKSLTLTYFYSRVTDLIQWDNSQYKNLEGKSTFKGIEVDYKNEILDNILFNINYTYLSAKDKDGVDLPRRADETLKFGLDFYGIEKLHFGINGEYIGSRYDEKAKTTQTGKYTVANFTANYDLMSNVKIYTKIDNISNKYYQTVDGFATSPRAYYAGVKVSF